MLDQEKAYDRLSLDFLWAVMHKLGFGDSFISLLQGLSTGAVARMQVNSALTPDFPILRGVRQGCPSAPLLFAISSIPFIQAVKNAARNGGLLTVVLPGGVSLDVSAFADDTAIFAFAIATIGKKIQALQLHRVSFEGRVVLLRFLVQTKLSYLLSFLHLWKSQLKIIRQLFRTMLWGLSVAGKAKTPLVAWDFLSAPGLLGGLGIWDVLIMEQSFLLKWVGLLLTNPPDAAWPLVFGLLCPRTRGRTLAEFLLLADFPDPIGSPMARRMLNAWDSLRNMFKWCPAEVRIPSDLPFGDGLVLLAKGGYISHNELSSISSSGAFAECSRWGDLSVLSQPAAMVGGALLAKLTSFPVVPGAFHFDPAEWRWHYPGSDEGRVFPVSVGGAYRALSSSSYTAVACRLNRSWDLHWPPQQWLTLFNLVWSKGVPSRDSIFLWRAIYKGFFTGEVSSKLHHQDCSCRDCGASVEDAHHALAGCSARRSLWTTLADKVTSVAVFARMLERGISIPQVLFSLLSSPAGSRLLPLLILVQGFRACWRRRCRLHFEGSAPSLS
ncbi:hypothetical protein R1sor_006472 [Riccia sorocarpa]|uniref:Reverse transcriptase domain-containing protein n=1 Tax=Riccia sorocarpa TaxID=122646 RepID=A0ABD3HPF5_9MARC